jgi:SSS family solute:Na+ symporter
MFEISIDRSTPIEGGLKYIVAPADWIVVALYGLLMAAIGVWSYSKVHAVSDFFAAGGKLPWWLSGISHHMSGYSGAVFVAHAGVAYSYGFSLYIWWALPISVAVIAGAFLIAPIWARLRAGCGMVSPLEYLAVRYDIPTQQVMAWSGIFLKLLDVGAKWASIAVILDVFAGVPAVYGILISGLISLFYIALGGLWADALTDLAQFVVQLAAGICLLVAVLLSLGGGPNAIFTLWDRLPSGHGAWFRGPYTAEFSLAYLVIAFFSYNGGTWNLAQRYLAAPNGSEARKAALLSGALYLLWPLVLFFPMWAAPIFLPNLSDPTRAYSLMVVKLLPPGLVGLVLASMFAHTMAMTTSDANTISAVFTRDVLPVLSRRLRTLSEVHSLRIARLTTITFTALSLAIAVETDRFGGVLSLLVTWFAALVGPTAVPMILGLLSPFRRSDSRAAILSWASGVLTFVALKRSGSLDMALTVGAPVLVSVIVFVIAGLRPRSRTLPSSVATLFAAVKGTESRDRVTVRA